MAPAIIKPETAKALKSVTENITLMDKESKAIKYADISKKLAESIKASNSEMIKLYLPQMNKVVEQTNHVIARSASALAGISLVKEDEDFTESHFETIEKLTKTVSETRMKLTKQLEEAEKLQDAGAKLVDSLQGGHDEGVEALAVLKDAMAQLKKIMDDVDNNYDKVYDAAMDAYNSRDQKGLTENRLKLIGYEEHGRAIDALRARVTAFMKKYHDHDLINEAQYILDDMSPMEDTLKRVKQYVKDTLSVGQVEKIDVAKAAKLLGINSKDQAELGKVLNGPSAGLVKGLDVLAKKLKLDTNAKEMLATLKKGGIDLVP